MNKDQKQLIADYSLALENHLEATSREVQAKIEVRQTHYALLMAKEALRNMEMDSLSNEMQING